MLRVARLSKAYPAGKGQIRTVLNAVSFNANQGEVLGLLGPNGAGKTTLLRIAAGLIAADSGQVCIGDQQIDPVADRVKARIGYQSPDTAIYHRLGAIECLEYFARLYGVNQSDFTRRIGELDAWLGLGPLLGERLGRMSTGQRQRVNLARAMIHDPDVLLLDEPFTGLDVLTSRSVVQVMLQARQSGKIVIFSSHQLQQVAHLCDRVVLLHRGQLLFDGEPDNLLENTGTNTIESAFLAVCGD